jgi:hypothetical protein
LSLETCRGGKINTWKKWKKCVKLVENPQLPQDARSTEYKFHNVICESPYATSPLSFCLPVQHRYVRLASYLQTDRQFQPHFALTLWNGTFTRNVLCFAIIHCGTTQSKVIINLSVSNEVNEIWKLVSRGKCIIEKRTNREREVKRNSTPKTSLCASVFLPRILLWLCFILAT